MAENPTLQLVTRCTGELSVKKDKDNLPVLSLAGERMAAAVDKISTILLDKSCNLIINTMVNIIPQPFDNYGSVPRNV